MTFIHFVSSSYRGKYNASIWQRSPAGYDYEIEIHHRESGEQVYRIRMDESIEDVQRHAEAVLFVKAHEGAYIFD